ARADVREPLDAVDSFGLQQAADRLGFHLVGDDDESNPGHPLTLTGSRSDVPRYRIGKVEISGSMNVFDLSHARKEERAQRERAADRRRTDQCRPSTDAGTWRCLIVAHTIVPAVSSPLKRRHATMSCHEDVARPYPATASVAS